MKVRKILLVRNERLKISLFFLKKIMAYYIAHLNVNNIIEQKYLKLK